MDSKWSGEDGKAQVRFRPGGPGASVDDEGGAREATDHERQCRPIPCAGGTRKHGPLPAWSRFTEFQPETLRAIVSIGFRDQVLLTADRTIAEQAPTNIFFGTACPVVEHFGDVLREPDRHHLLVHEASLSWDGEIMTAV
jgi:hypothetical protein